MALDFIGFINSNTPGLTGAQKTAMLSDFCESFLNGVDDVVAPGERVKFANDNIQAWIVGRVNAVRRRRAEAVVTIEKLSL